MEAVPAIGGPSEYEPPELKKNEVEAAGREQDKVTTVQDLNAPVVKDADQKQSFKTSVMGAAYTGKGSVIDFML